ncbi:PD-(D/E)XK motif protein [Patiriisocius sp. Uisw_047]|uniref:PD-(D/E)XK motif protein n=1 Tax=Patiriisocius sp. Uisw_047 TaxID=3230969 RepID=UPI0039E976A1
MMNNIKDIWIEQANASEKKVIRQKVKEVTGVNCFIGTISFSKAKIFSVEIPSEIKVHPNYLKRFSGVEVQVLLVVNNKRELAILLLEEELTDVFILFIEDIIKSLLPLKNSEEVLLIISNRINYWKKLFGKFSSDLLTPQQQRGLFGELFFIKKLLDNNTDIKKTIEAWQAPLATNQDFYFNRKAVEVKTSKSNSPTIKIANEFQLDITGLNQLYIAFFKLNEYPDDKNTLLKLIIEIRGLLNHTPSSLNEFNSKLEYMRVTSELEVEYDKTGYSVRSEKYYHITEKFPKITSSMINDAISKVSYEISPNGCNAFETTFDSVLKDLFHG